MHHLLTTIKQGKELITYINKEWRKTKVPILSAALSFYAMFSIGPMLIIIIFLASNILRSSVTKTVVFEKMRLLLGQSATNILEKIVNNIQITQQNVLFYVFSLIVIIFVATNFFSFLHKSFDIIWEQKTKKDWLEHEIKSRIISLVLIVLLSFFLVITSTINLFVVHMTEFMHQYLLFSSNIIYTTYVLLSAATIIVIVGTLFRYLPTKIIPWKAVWPGAIITSILFLIGYFITGFYVAQSNLASAYGATSSLLLFLLWIFYSAQIFYGGVLFTKGYAHKHGHLKPITKKTSKK